MLQTVYGFVSDLAPRLLKIVAVFNKKIALFADIQVKAKADIVNLKEWRDKLKGKVCWIHCASLGEFEQGRPIIERLKALENPPNIVLTFFSSSGYEIRKNYPLADWVGYLPLDNRKGSGLFVDALRPNIAIFVKYEFWPYYLDCLYQKGIPSFAVSVIMREDHFILKSYSGYFRDALRKFKLMFVQNEKSASILADHAIYNVQVAGDTRFDTVLKNKANAQNLERIQLWAGKSPILIAGSTWPEDDKLVLGLLDKIPDLKIILVPHEIHQAELEKIKAEHKGVFYSNLKPNIQTRLLIINQIGLLSSIYQFGTLAYIGGAFGKGLHNTLEAATFGLPIFFGNKTYAKFQEAVDLLELNHAKTVENIAELEKYVDMYLNDRELLNSKKAEIIKYIEGKAGATEIIMEHVKPLLKSK